jgi:hypothetical protein
MLVTGLVSMVQSLETHHFLLMESHSHPLNLSLDLVAVAQAVHVLSATAAAAVALVELVADQQQAPVALVFSHPSQEHISAVVALAVHGTVQVALVALAVAETAVMAAAQFAEMMVLLIPVVAVALWVTQVVPTGLSAQVEVVWSSSATQQRMQMSSSLHRAITSFNMPRQLIPHH